jgi:tRNA threonylcarbamoyladenosine biosynthesis protein TsaE
MEKIIKSDNRQCTLAFGEHIGKALHKGDVIALCGELGSGKTVLAKGIAKGLKVKRGNYVNSPSFVILKEYKGRLPLYHFDVYRLKDIDNFATVGYGEYFYGNGVSIVEWADKIKEALPNEYLLVEIEIIDENRRRLKIKAKGHKYAALLKKI